MKPLVLISAILMLLSVACPLWAGDSGVDHSNSMSAGFHVSPVVDSLIREYVERIDADSIGSYIDQLVGFKTRFMLADNRREIAEWIREKFRSFGYDGVEIDSFQNTIEFPMRSGELQSTWQYNVSVRLAGSEKPSDISVLGAHYDCMILGPGSDPYKYAPGADNNASGVAACLEIARIFKQNQLEPRYTIEFVAFGSEEFMTMFIDGGSGAQHYIHKQTELGNNMLLMIDNNQIAFASDSSQWALDFQNYPGAEWVTDLAHSICKGYARIIPVDTNDHILYSDARYFYEAGVPAIFFEENHFNPYTFTDEDTPENCNVEYCAEVAKISCGMLIYLNK